jgi:hypothetical protein
MIPELKEKTAMKQNLKFTLSLLALSVFLLAVYAVSAQTRTSPDPRPEKKNGFVQTSSGSTLPVHGGGTTGRLTKWTGFNSTASYIGDSIISESKTGLVGIGTDAPTSKLTVQGMIHTTLGGYKFPDGTVQTTAAVSGLQSIIHDGTLKGDGTQASPLGVAVPLNLDGPLSVVNSNNLPGLSAVLVKGGDSSTDNGQDGLLIYGGKTNDFDTTEGGNAIKAFGGDSANGVGGAGVLARGGSGPFGGAGVRAFGNVVPAGDGFGGAGIEAGGGDARGMGKTGGPGIIAFGGNGFDGATNGLAGSFLGAVEVQGDFNVTGGGTKNFKIDHPLDPENKYLYHAAIESSEVLNIYSGNVTTDGNGEATVTLPDWFEAVNRDFRYQLTVVGAFAQAIVGEKIRDNRFTIRTSAPGIEVSWQVTGVRSDPAILKHPFKVEEDKPQSERGYYLEPDAYNQPEERGIEWSRNPEFMQRLKHQRLEQEQATRPTGLDR